MIVDCLAKIVYYKPVNVTNDALGLAKVIINMLVCHFDISKSIITNQGSLFISKF